MLKAEIITIGDEIVSGKSIDTNSVFIAQQLANIGIETIRKISVRDDIDDIIKFLQHKDNNVQIKILTGGLGPTSDDMTVNALCEFFRTNLIYNEQVYNHLTDFFKHRNWQMSEANKAQAMVPEKAIVLQNNLGTASGLMFDENGTLIFALPGVPFEMQALMSNQVIPRIIEKFQAKTTYFSHDFLFVSIGESMIYEKIKTNPVFDNHHLEIAYLPSIGFVIVRLGIRNVMPEIAVQYFLEAELEFQDIFPENYVGKDVENFAKHIQEICISNSLTLGIAESCTGGFLSHLITLNSGSSGFFKGSVISYSNEIKNRLLKVDEILLSTYGAVSQEVVSAMASGTQKLLNTDFAIAISGIAGPDGGSVEKPVGTVHVAVANKNNTILTECFHFGPNERKTIIHQAAYKGLFMLWREFLSKYKQL